MAEDGGRIRDRDQKEVGERRRKRRRKRAGLREKEKESPPSSSPESESKSTDPLVVLGPDVMTKVLEFLDARSVARLLVVSRQWHQIAVSDRIWTPKCEELLVGKAHIPRLFKVRGASKLQSYSMSIMDGKRSRIVKEDLCDHVWEFRFQETAPEYWLNLDPAWKRTGPPMHRYFHPDGSVTADPDDQVWGGHECSFLIMTSYVGQGTIREHYVRINRWPPMTVSRKDDWSWELSNHMYRYNSIPDAEKGRTGPLFPVW